MNRTEELNGCGVWEKENSLSCFAFSILPPTFQLIAPGFSFESRTPTCPAECSFHKTVTHSSCVLWPKGRSRDSSQDNPLLPPGNLEILGLAPRSCLGSCLCWSLHLQFFSLDSVCYPWLSLKVFFFFWKFNKLKFFVCSEEQNCLRQWAESRSGEFIGEWWPQMVNLAGWKQKTSADCGGHV